MSPDDTLIEAREAVDSDRFVEVRYDDAIPNNVDLSSDRQLLRALESWHPAYLDWWKDMGRTASRTPRSTCARRWGWIRPAGPSSAT